MAFSLETGFHLIRAFPWEPCFKLRLTGNYRLSIEDGLWRLVSINWLGESRQQIDWIIAANYLNSPRKHTTCFQLIEQYIHKFANCVCKLPNSGSEGALNIKTHKWPMYAWRQRARLINLRKRSWGYQYASCQPQTVSILDLWEERVTRTPVFIHHYVCMNDMIGW